MRFLKSKLPVLFTERLKLRLPELKDYHQWSDLRYSSQDFLKPWEPTWTEDHLTKEAFQSRVEWAEKAAKQLTSLPLLIFRREDNEIIGGITLDQIQFGPHQSGSLGYWVGERFARQGFMYESLQKIVHHSFKEIGISRIEAACIPNNKPSRKLLEKTDFKYEGVAQSYLEIAGTWQPHVLYANLRNDRRNHADTNQ